MACAAGGLKTGEALAWRQCLRQRMFILNFFLPSCKESGFLSSVDGRGLDVEGRRLDVEGRAFNVEGLKSRVQGLKSRVDDRKVEVELRSY